MLTPSPVRLRAFRALARAYSVPAAAAHSKQHIVNIVEVGPRDGLQNEKGAVIPVETKVELVERLVRAGVSNVEAGSFVSPKWVPQMGGTADVLKRLTKERGVHYSVLVPNQRGLDDLLLLLAQQQLTDLGSPPLTDEISVFVAATDAFNKANLNCTVPESLQKIAAVTEAATKHGLRVRGYVSVVIACPYSGRTDYHKVREVASALLNMGCYEVSLGDTVGMGRPHEVAEMLDVVKRSVPVEQLAGHFHDTYGTAIANVLTALEHGVRTIDASVGGLGGCPYSPGATGNVSTEDVLYALQGSQYHVAGRNGGTINLEEMVDIGWWISEKLGRESASRVGRALRAKARKTTTTSLAPAINCVLTGTVLTPHSSCMLFFSLPLLPSSPSPSPAPRRTMKETYTFDPRPNYPLRLTATRYSDTANPHLHNPDALTLIFAHGTGFHKEQWEPTIAELERRVGDGVKIREYWSVEAPNHGDSAALNEDVLKLGYTPVCEWRPSWMGRVCTKPAPLLIRPRDRHSHRLFAAQARRHRTLHGRRIPVRPVLTAGYFPTLKFHSLICVELMCSSEAFGTTAKSFLINGAEKRRDTWSSREEAYNVMKTRGTWKEWDDRVLRNYIEYGLKPTGDGSTVTLKCARTQEAACYRDPIGPRRAYHLFPSFVKSTRTHLIYGAIDDYLPAAVKDDILRRVGGESSLGSYARVPGAGHLVVQMNPTGLAEKFLDALARDSKLQVD
ncbi:hypothetical protein DFP72DRAFT_826186 [Ephemerocybe angulata]|uniref:hydroxymethylglutaryl-CoA lyase n=1 Tax=Ephemerocybe angulata TaxID=980116 RepID=A0A8H6LX24_9AGAR|nr:hypothetical protein DFP72DRAFT_826186 [Tulosesus angulatus]